MAKKVVKKAVAPKAKPAANAAKKATGAGMIGRGGKTTGRTVIG